MNAKKSSSKIAPLPKVPQHSPEPWNVVFVSDGQDGHGWEQAAPGMTPEGFSYRLQDDGGQPIPMVEAEANAALIKVTPAMARELANFLTFRHAVAYALGSRPETQASWEMTCQRVAKLLVAAEVR